jgi:hypothetical protein
LKKRRVDRREDRRGRPDPETDRDDHRQREHWSSQEVAHRDAQVLRQILDEERSLHAFLLLLVLPLTVPACVFEVPELTDGLAPRLVGRQAARLEFLDSHLQVHAELFVDLLTHGRGSTPEIPELHEMPPRTASTARE